MAGSRIEDTHLDGAFGILKERASHGPTAARRGYVNSGVFGLDPAKLFDEVIPQLS